MENGVPLPDDVWTSIVEAARAIGVPQALIEAANGKR
jgi:hypothetical protein